MQEGTAVQLFTRPAGDAGAMANGFDVDDQVRIIKTYTAGSLSTLADGTLDLPNRILKRLDLTVCAIHYEFDLDDVHCRLAKDMGLLISIATDAHSTIGLGVMCYGIGQEDAVGLSRRTSLARALGDH
jgi:histidinol phosphatase-like PHP family hydrolase